MLAAHSKKLSSSSTIIASQAVLGIFATAAGKHDEESINRAIGECLCHPNRVGAPMQS